MLFFVSHYTLIAASNAITPRNIALVALILLILNLSRLSFWLVAFPFVLLHAIYLPIAKIFGKINYGFVASAFATDHAETLEFLKMLGGGNRNCDSHGFGNPPLQRRYQKIQTKTS